MRDCCAGRCDGTRMADVRVLFAPASAPKPAQHLTCLNACWRCSDGTASSSARRRLPLQRHCLDIQQRTDEQLCAMICVLLLHISSGLF